MIKEGFGPPLSYTKSLKNYGFSTSGINAKIRSRRNEFSDWHELIFLHKRKRLFPKNACLTYMPPGMIEDGEVSHLPKPLLGFANSLRIPRACARGIPIYGNSDHREGVIL